MQRKEKKKKKIGKQGQVTIYVFWFITAIMVVILGALVAPIGARFTSEMYTAGEGIILDANHTIQNIQNDSVKASIMGIYGEATQATETNIEVLTDVFQYSWIIVVILSAVVAFLYTRQLVEFQGGGFV